MATAERKDKQMNDYQERVNQHRLGSQINAAVNIEKARRENPQHWLYNGEVFNRMLDEALEYQGQVEWAKEGGE